VGTVGGPAGGSVELSVTVLWQWCHTGRGGQSNEGSSNVGLTLFIHGVCMLRERIYGECAHEQHVRRTLTQVTQHDHCLLR